MVERSQDVQSNMLFDSLITYICREQIVYILGSLNIDGKYLRVVNNIILGKTVAIQIANYISEFLITRYLRKVCVLSFGFVFFIQRDHLTCF